MSNFTKKDIITFISTLFHIASLTIVIVYLIMLINKGFNKPIQFNFIFMPIIIISILLIISLILDIINLKIKY